MLTDVFALAEAGEFMQETPAAASPVSAWEQPVLQSC